VHGWNYKSQIPSVIARRVFSPTTLAHARSESPDDEETASPLLAVTPL
jgi:hypothetical protein